ncbi:MAG: hypothetical protein J1E62_04555 [Lachnospiraceae bacterium]|nr:hypothetical protein [Lachnospiraceae bacterium]
MIQFVKKQKYQIQSITFYEGTSLDGFIYVERIKFGTNGRMEPGGH